MQTGFSILLQATPTPLPVLVAADDFWSFLRDAGWWQVILAVVALIVGFAIFRIQTQRKSLSYKIISSRPLFQAETNVKQKFEISFEGHRVNDLHQLIIQITNSGNTPITPSDFVRPLTLLFDSDSVILSAEITESIPSNLGATLEVKETVEPIGLSGHSVIHRPFIAIEPVLLNKRDSLTLEVLLNPYKEMTVDGRVVGVNKISVTTERSTDLIAYGAAIIAVLVSFEIGSSAGNVFGPNIQVADYKLAFTIAVLVLFIFATLLSVRLLRKH